jgi:hypothetical protein
VQLDSQAITVSISGFDVAITETTNRDINGTYVVVDVVDNVHATATVTVIQSDTSSGTESAYTVDAEIRSVDGSVYVMASYLDSEGDVAELPEGWTVVDEANLFQFGFLDIGDLIETEVMEDDNVGLDENDIFADRELLESLVESVTVDAMELEDGTAVDLITIAIKGEGFADLMGDELDLGLGDEDMADFMGALFDAVSFNLQFALDADDNVRQTTFTLTINVEDMDASFIPQVPEGMEAALSLHMERVETNTYSDINADLEPIEAPE